MTCSNGSWFWLWTSELSKAQLLPVTIVLHPPSPGCLVSRQLPYRREEHSNTKDVPEIKRSMIKVVLNYLNLIIDMLHQRTPQKNWYRKHNIHPPPVQTLPSQHTIFLYIIVKTRLPGVYRDPPVPPRRPPTIGILPSMLGLETEWWV